MTYLTDVSSDSPAFKVIPQTHTFVPEQGDLRGDDRGFAQLSPSGRPRPADAHTPLGMAKRLLTTAVGTGMATGPIYPAEIPHDVLNFLIKHAGQHVGLGSENGVDEVD